MYGKKWLIAAISGLTALSVATPALAIMSIPNGWYLEGNIGSTKLSNLDFNNSSSSSGIGGNVNFGYKFMPYVGFEAGYSRYANTSLNAPNGTKIGTDKFYSYDLALRGILPMADTGFELFAKLGAGRVNARVTEDNSNLARQYNLANGSHTATGIYYAAGAQYYWIPELAINVQYAQAQGSSNSGTLSLISGGISFIFD